MNWKKIGVKGVIGTAIGTTAAIALVPLIGGFGVVAMGGAVGTALAAGVAGLFGGAASAGTEAYNQATEKV